MLVPCPSAVTFHCSTGLKAKEPADMETSELKELLLLLNGFHQEFCQSDGKTGATQPVLTAGKWRLQDVSDSP